MYKNLLYTQISLLFLSFLTILQICFLIFNFSKGLNTTDDSYYLLSSLHFKDMKYEISKFYIIFGYVLKFLDYNIYYLRIFGLLILVLSTYFFIHYFNIYNKFYFKSDEYYLFLLCSVNGILNYYYNWQTNPSYNLLNIVGFLLLIGSFFGIIKNYKNSFINYIKFILAGTLGVAFITFAKVASIIIFLPILFFLLYLFLEKKIFFQIIFSSSILLLVMFIIFISNFYSFPIFYEDIFGAYEMRKLMGYNQNGFFGLIYSNLKEIIFEIFKYLYIFLFLFFTVIICDLKIFRKINSLIFISSIFLILFFTGSLITIVFFLFILSLIDYLMNIKKNENKKFLYILTFLCFTSFSISFGTNTGIVNHIKYSYIFLIIIIYFFIIKFVSKNNYDKFISLFIILFFISINIYNGYKYPMRLSQGISYQNYEVSFPFMSGKLLVDEYTYNKIIDIRNLAFTNGWKNGNTLIDLTGRNPFYHLALGGKFLNHAWINSAFNPNKSFEFFYSKVNQSKIDNSWLLVNEMDTLKFNEKNYEKYISKEINYLKVGEVYSSIKSHQKYRYSLWKPK